MKAPLSHCYCMAREAPTINNSRTKHLKRDLPLLLLNLHTVEGSRNEHDGPAEEYLGSDVQTCIAGRLCVSCDGVGALCQAPDNGVACNPFPSSQSKNCNGDIYESVVSFSELAATPIRGVQ